MGARSARRRVIVFPCLAALMTALLVTAAAQPADTAEADGAASPTAPASVLALRVEGLITAGTAAFLEDQIQHARDAGYQAVLLSLDTPGGLVDATLEIVQAISQSNTPVIAYVEPSGAIAASAGSFILVASHVAAMAPGTTTGAAMPVTLDPASGGGAEPAGEKTTKFLAGHMRSLARQRDRPAEVVERFVTENLTLEAEQALDERVIDLIATDREQLLRLLDGRQVRVGDREVRLRTAGATVVEAQMSLAQYLQNLVSNPQLAFFLLIGGAYALYFGLTAPGTLVPETLGAISLLLGLYGLGLFDTNLAGWLLMGLGLAFIIMELFAPTHGALSAAGAISLALGALLLPAEPLLPEAWFASFRSTVLGLAIAAGLLSVLVAGAVLQSRRRLRQQGPPAVLPRRGRAVDDLDPEGYVRIGGELWRAVASGGTAIPAGSTVEVVARDGLTLYVRSVPGPLHSPLPPPDTDDETGNGRENQL